MSLQIYTKLHGFHFKFSKIFWEGAHRAPSPDPSPRFFSGFALESGFALNSRAFRALDSGFALNFGPPFQNPGSALGVRAFAVGSSRGALR